MANFKYQKLTESKLIRLEGEYGFIIATEIDISNIENGVMLFRGDGYNYEDLKKAELDSKGLIEIQFSVEEDQYHLLDDEGGINYE